MKRSRRLKYVQANAGMTLIEVALAIGFMALFVMALMAASAGVERLVRGYTCRVLSADSKASSPARGCTGQSDEVSATGIAAIKVANTSAFQALRNELVAVGLGGLGPITINSQSFDFASAIQRHSELESKCLWEKISPRSGGVFRATRNYWRVSDSAVHVSYPTPGSGRLPAPSARVLNHTYWFIRAGRLIGEKTISTPGGEVELQRAEGLQNVESQWLSVDPPSGGFAAISEAEDLELRSGTNEIVNAPDRAWGLLNQVCIFHRPTGSLGNLYLLSGERGKDLGANSHSDINPAFFGRQVQGGARHLQPRLLFYVP